MCGTAGNVCFLMILIAMFIFNALNISYIFVV